MCSAGASGDLSFRYRRNHEAIRMQPYRFMGAMRVPRMLWKPSARVLLRNHERVCRDGARPRDEMLLRIWDGRVCEDGHGQGHRQEYGAIGVKRFGGEVARDLIKFKTERDDLSDMVGK